jgi:hypothetical protein
MKTAFSIALVGATSALWTPSQNKTTVSVEAPEMNLTPEMEAKF